MTFLQSNSLCTIHQEGDPGVFERLLDVTQCPVKGNGLFLLERGYGPACTFGLLSQIILGPAQPCTGRPALFGVNHSLTVNRINSVNSSHFVHFKRRLINPKGKPMHNEYPVSSTSDAQSGPKRAYAPETTPLPIELREAVDAALQECFDKIYCSDELLGNKLTQVKGPLDSLSKRHGILLEEAIAHAFVAAAGDRYEVQTQVAVKVSREAMSLVESNQLEKLEGLNLPIDNSHGKKAVIDIVVFDHETRDLHVISVKRGGGAQGGRDARGARKDLTAAGLMLKNHALRKGLPVLAVRQVLVDWYGRSGIVGRPTVTRTTVDEYFGVPISGFVEAMSAYMSASIAQRMMPRLMTAIGRSGHTTDRSTENASGLPLRDKGDVSDDEHVRTNPNVFPSLAECLSDLPLRRQGRQMRRVSSS